MRSDQQVLSEPATLAWDKAEQCWRVLVDGVPQSDGNGSLAWARFNDAYDAAENFRRAARSSQ